jgi:hypothetical protein
MAKARGVSSSNVANVIKVELASLQGIRAANAFSAGLCGIYTVICWYYFKDTRIIRKFSKEPRKAKRTETERRGEKQEKEEK